MICEIKAYGRIHAGLIDLSDEGYRMNGGVGWAIDGFLLVVRARCSSKFHVSDNRVSPVTAEELEALRWLLEEFARAHSKEGAIIEIGGDLPSHKGVGAGTALRLAMLEACTAIWEVRTSPSELVRFSKRGGTSGVGVRTYFEGGLIVDIGHRRTQPAAPSRDRGGAGPPLPLLRVNMPKWRFGLVCLPEIEAVNITTERAVFADSLPLPQSDVHATLYDVIFGVVGGVLERDQEMFAAALDALQKRRWKSAEWRLHGDAVVNLAAGLRAAGARGVALSSMGPTLYFLKAGSNSAKSDWPADVRWVDPVNQGRELRLIKGD